MSVTRTTDVNTDNKPTSVQKENINTWKILQVGVTAGLIKSTVLFPLDKFCYYFQTEKGSSSWAKGFEHIRAQGFCKGYPMCTTSAIINQITLLATQPIIKNKLEQSYPNLPTNNFTSGFATGLFSTYLLSPLAVTKTQMMLNKSFKEITQIPYRAYYNGVHTKAATDGIQAGLFFSIQAYIAPYIKNSTVTGAISGFIASIFSNPLAVVMVRQRSKGEVAPFIKTVLEIYAEKGLTGFYPKYLSSTGLRSMINYAILGTASEYLKFFPKSSNNNQNTCGNKNTVEKPRKQLGEM